MPNKFGENVKKQWKWLFDQYDYLKIDEYYFMPNQFHGIIWISPVWNDHVGNDPLGNGRDRSPRGEKIKSIPELIGAFKTTSSKIIHLAGYSNFRWQKSYHYRIIRSEFELNRIRQYIVDNPSNWKMDNYYAV